MVTWRGHWSEKDGGGGREKASLGFNRSDRVGGCTSENARWPPCFVKSREMKWSRICYYGTQILLSRRHFFEFQKFLTCLKAEPPKRTQKNSIAINPLPRNNQRRLISYHWKLKVSTSYLTRHFLKCIISPTFLHKGPLSFQKPFAFL